MQLSKYHRRLGLLSGGEVPRLAQLFSFSSSIRRKIVQILILVGVSPHFGSSEYATARDVYLHLKLMAFTIIFSLLDSTQCIFANSHAWLSTWEEKTV